MCVCVCVYNLSVCLLSVSVCVKCVFVSFVCVCVSLSVCVCVCLAAHFYQYYVSPLSSRPGSENSKTKHIKSYLFYYKFADSVPPLDIGQQLSSQTVFIH